MARPQRYAPLGASSSFNDCIVRFCRAFRVAMLTAGAGSLLSSTAAQGEVLRVGPGQSYSRPSEAAAWAKDGDIVEIAAAGAYDGDVAVWPQNRLTLRGVGGRPRLVAAGNAAQGKAIWVIAGNGVHVDNLEFAGAAVPADNGAGIRAEGDSIIVRNSIFHHNQMGILTGNSAGDVVVENCEFYEHGPAPRGITHSLYIGYSRSAVVRGNYFHSNHVGHHVKSRAATNFIAYAIDISNGGLAVVLGNAIQQGPRNENPGIIAFAMEGATNPKQELYVVNNTIVNDAPDPASAFVQTREDSFVYLTNNLLAGEGVVLRGGAGAVLGNVLAVVAGQRPRLPALSSAAPWNKEVLEPRLVDIPRYDYRPLVDSPVVDAGTASDQPDGMSVVPMFEPSRPRGMTRRKGTRSVGAFEPARSP
jgi:hypothetical protein